MKLEVQDGFDRDRVEERIRTVMYDNELCTLATVSGDQKAHAATAFYAFDSELNLYILTPPDTEHGHHLAQNSSIALAIYDSHQEWNDDKQGLQVSGTAEKLENQDEVAEALKLYTKRFPEMEEFASSPGDVEELDSRFYRIEPSRVKIFDEPRFGKETWVEVKMR